MERSEALRLVEEALTRVVPDADVGALEPDLPFRDALEFDSLDFLAFVETLSERSGLRIDEDDYPRLTTLDDTSAFLAARAP
ncbi:phosphopantetheine-binding protein [Streptomyces pluripotens]|uniref:Phosphopantetheine-binding protein n=1 Tax=Streptomyces pluripotens TaxID=1355015 RepID=A0A221NSG3_9ACTN|nr:MULTISPECIES: acyl carrier protein [Streptomyces]ARP68659.1 phosphopantetheine-binding protein [Streptomyces pluripotens]ASN22917.1 phosphopantetheine-binding protein [Streptomyces pluripotens]KIE26710.1 phosphopantetheine-binding protein [Streptomyces sp. MUSC 125]MCH0559247.1 acyl carrier protein [Streptomyces sp. MUM 16J]